MHISPDTYPNIVRVIERGHAYIDEYKDVIGIASDGKEVCLGNCHALDKTERYLSDRPTPDLW